MNLVSGLEDMPGVFYAVAGGTFAAIYLVFFAMRDYTLLSSPAGRHASRVKTFLGRVGKASPPAPVSIFGRAWQSLSGASLGSSLAMHSPGVLDESLRLSPTQFREYVPVVHVHGSRRLEGLTRMRLAGCTKRPRERICRWRTST